MRTLCFLCLLLLCQTSLARDPFDKTQRQPAISTESKGLPAPYQRTPACENQPAFLLEDLDFEQLDLVGVLIGKDQRQVLFRHEKQGLVMVRLNEVISQQHWQISQIEKQQIQLRAWLGEQCQFAPAKQMRF